MQLNYTLTVDDYRQGFKALRQRRLWSRVTYWFGYGVVAVAAIMLMLTLVLFGTSGLQHALPLVFLALVWAAMMWLSPWLSARRIVSGPVYTAPHTVNIDDDGIHSRTAVAEGTISWPSIVAWQEVDRIFAIFLSPVAFIPIPKRAMTADQQAEFRDMLQQRIKVTPGPGAPRSRS